MPTTGCNCTVEPVSLDESPKGGARSEEVVLPDHVVQSARSHSRRQGSVLGEPFLGCGVP